ncbi:MAG: hypothetical protein ACKPKO_00570, partial [Candidatus Fonsibacter sp.]
MGKTATDENLQADKRYWHNFFLTNKLDEVVLNNFLYGTNPLQNYVGLIDARNHDTETTSSPRSSYPRSRSSG